ncbi:MAG TPA: YciI family protein [Candidatus Dormibacteraeota bacterium]|nr:YciI family protein [Candidatus Dormibacteraeota bacterium]
MKYVLLFVGTREDQDRWDEMSPEQVQATMGGAGEWFEKFSRQGKIVGGEQLQGYKTVSTIQGRNGNRVVTDGPFIESKEVIGGFAIVDVKDRNEAEEMAKTWPAGPVEVWPVVER